MTGAEPVLPPRPAVPPSAVALFGPPSDRCAAVPSGCPVRRRRAVTLFSRPAVLPWCRFAALPARRRAAAPPLRRPAGAAGPAARSRRAAVLLRFPASRPALFLLLRRSRRRSGPGRGSAAAGRPGVPSLLRCLAARSGPGRRRFVAAVLAVGRRCSFSPLLRCRSSGCPGRCCAVRAVPLSRRGPGCRCGAGPLFRARRPFRCGCRVRRCSSRSATVPAAGRGFGSPSCRRSGPSRCVVPPSRRSARSTP